MNYSTGCRRTGKGNQGTVGRTGRRTGDGGWEKQSSRKTGYAGMRTGGYVGGVCGKNIFLIQNSPLTYNRKYHVTQ